MSEMSALATWATGGAWWPVVASGVLGGWFPAVYTGVYVCWYHADLQFQSPGRLARQWGNSRSNQFLTEAIFDLFLQHNPFPSLSS